MVRQLFNTFLLLSLLAASHFAVAAQILVSVDRTQVQENESFSIKFTANSDVDGDPDFDPLEKDFHILNSSQSSNIQFINRQMSREFTWNLALMPKHTGELQIPSIEFGSDRTQPKSIKVSQAQAGGSPGGDLVYMEAVVDKNNIYVQSQVNYTLRIYHAVNLRNASLSELEVSDKDAVVEKLTENSKFEKFINGRRYKVFEKRYAIFPQTVGELVIEPVLLDAQYIDLPRSLRTRRVSSERIRVQVQPIPDAIIKNNLSYWLPAEELTLEEKWSDKVTRVKVGEPITRTLTLTATGLLASALPELASNTSIDGVKQYADQPILDNNVIDSDYIGKRQEKIAYIPSKPGQLQLPAIEITWWDTGINKMEQVRLPARKIMVVAGAQQDQPVQPLKQQQGAAQIPNEQKPANVSETVAKSPDGAGIASSSWFWISMGLLLLWLSTLVLWLRAARYNPRKQKVEPIKALQKTVNDFKQLKSACDKNDAQLAKNALIHWGKQQWPESPPTSLGHIMQRVNGKLATELRNLNNVLYKPGVSTWNSSGLWQSVKDYNTQQQQSHQPDLALQPLYRIVQLEKNG